MPGSRRTKLRGVLQASCCLKRSDCCLPPTPVYFLEDSRRFYELLSPVLLLLSLTVLQLRPTSVRSSGGSVYSVSCSDCSATYVGETGSEEDKKQESSKMETNEIRAVIEYLCKKGMSPKEIYEDMVDTLREDAPSYSTVKNG
ncbi:hypothetical protein LAZ67_X001261 [Cordylochernes scorpioides]|uniref:Mos1 transposase HTH domain-containing protein n=1 Tax=Cordylochernes scorpioides TaxID=51811 RepID=A0ABY6LWI8_9ARAC|nr:hypothetical protein LAZ67_X001261 [Cordylochernes scorpioides]